MANIEYIQTCILFHIGTETYLVESENDTPNHLKLVIINLQNNKDFF